eukprot:6218628-Amphidinium_carterae.1
MEWGINMRMLALWKVHYGRELRKSSSRAHVGGEPTVKHGAVAICTGGPHTSKHASFKRKDTSPENWSQ